MSKLNADEHWEDCEFARARDARGRWRRGTSGNPNGRPRKPEPEPWSLSRRIFEALLKEVPVTNGGNNELLTLRDLLVESVVRALPKAKPKEALDVLERFEKMGALDMGVDEPSECLSTEERLLLDIIAQKYRPACGRCGAELYDFEDERGEG